MSVKTWMSSACLIVVAFLPMLARGQWPQTQASASGQMSYIDNGVIRVGIDLSLGGAITYLSRSGTNAELNLINSFDWGRQVQLSYYSGPNPFHPPGTRIKNKWENLGWNPIQSGDSFGNRARVLQHTNDGANIYLKCVPMQWPLENAPGECNCEVWLSLHGAAVRVRCRLNNQRSDHAQYTARSQELPAVYVNGPFYRLFTYRGDKPFTGDSLSQIQKHPGESGPWTSWTTTENWAAQINDRGWGVGVWNPGAFEFTGGFVGKPGVGGPADSTTGYISPLRTEVIDWNIVYDYNYELIVGTLEEIRSYVYRQRSRESLNWAFENSREGWFYRNAVDKGWPIRGELDVVLEGNDPQVISPVFFARAEDCPVLSFDAAFDTRSSKARVYWRALDQPFDEVHSKVIEIEPDGRFHHFEIALSSHPEYKGSLVQIRIDPVETPPKGARFQLRSVRLGTR